MYLGHLFPNIFLNFLYNDIFWEPRVQAERAVVVVGRIRVVVTFKMCFWRQLDGYAKICYNPKWEMIDKHFL
jgi:hypothetical protein